MKLFYVWMRSNYVKGSLLLRYSDDEIVQFWEKQLLQKNVRQELVLVELDCLMEALVVIRGRGTRSAITFHEYGLLLDVESKISQGFSNKKSIKDKFMKIKFFNRNNN